MSEMSAIRKSARGKACTLRLPGCAPGPNNETVVLAHLPSADKALGLKSPDWWAVYACASCHDRIDGRQLAPDDLWVLYAALLRGLFETQKQLFELGLLTETR